MFNKLSAAILLLALSVAPVFAQNAVRVDAAGNVDISMPPAVRVGYSNWYDVYNYGITSHRLSYRVNGTPASFTLTLECSNTGSETATSVLGTGTTVTGGAITATGTPCTKVRWHLSALSGTATIYLTYHGGFDAAGAAATVAISQSGAENQIAFAAPQHVIVDSGASGGTTDTDDGSIAVSQSTGINLSLMQFYDGTVWRRYQEGTAGVNGGGVKSIQGVASGIAVPISAASATFASGAFASGSFASGSHASGSFASGAFASGSVASGAFAAGALADGADVTLGAKADAKSTATDTTAVSAISVLKQISASVQAPPSQAVTNAGTFATQSAVTAALNSLVDGSLVTLGAKADAKSTATDTTAVTAMSVLKEISAMEQAPASRAVTAISGGFADGAIATIGAKADAKSTATDTTAITLMQVAKQISASVQAIAALAATDPCSGAAKVNKSFAISSATTTVLVAASASNKLYVCSLSILPISAADNFEFVEDATGSCVSPDAGIIGDTTDTAGANMVANQGFIYGNGSATVAVTASTNVNVCAITSTTAKLNGNLTYVLAP